MRSSLGSSMFYDRREPQETTSIGYREDCKVQRNRIDRDQNVN